MTAARLALRTVRCGRPRAQAAGLAVAAAACALTCGGGEAALLLSLLSVVACASAAGMALQVLARQRELATLRALGMSRPALVLMLELEVLWITCGAAVPGLGIGAIAARATSRFSGMPSMPAGPGAVTLSSLGTLLVLVLTTALLAALVPAIRAARRDVASGLAVLAPRQDA